LHLRDLSIGRDLMFIWELSQVYTYVVYIVVDIGLYALSMAISIPNSTSISLSLSIPLSLSPYTHTPPILINLNLSIFNSIYTIHPKMNIRDRPLPSQHRTPQIAPSQLQPANHTSTLYL
jgi:hypothetical protein